MAGIMAEPVRNKIIKTLHINEDASWFRALQIGKTWIIIIIGEMFSCKWSAGGHTDVPEYVWQAVGQSYDPGA